jgi:SNF2 family DNA or RNA helicase
VLGKAAGTIDYRDEHFVARFAYDAALVAEIKTLKQGTRQKSSDEWIIQRHRLSVAKLVRIGRDRSWHFTAEANKAIQQLREQGEAAQFSLDVVQGKVGEPWFLCMLGDDYDLQQRVKSIPGAYLDDADDSWWVPAFRAASCELLLEIAQDDDRLTVSPAAWRLLEEPDESFTLPRSAAVPTTDHELEKSAEDAVLLGGTWDSTDFEYHMHTLSSATHEEDFKVSPALRRELLPFQVAGVRYACLAPRAFLADERGLGKTVQALAAIETLDAYPALIVCPAPLQLNWVREAQRWLPEGRTISALHGAFEAVPTVDVLVVHYELLARHHQLLGERGFESIVADESHYLRNRDAQRTRAAIEIASTVPSLRLCLSANPSPRQPLELAPQLEFLGILDQEFDGFWPFVSRYCAPKDDGEGMRFGAARMDELAQRLRSTCYVRRERSAVLAQLPEKSRAVHCLELEDRATYVTVEETARETLRLLSLEQEQDDIQKEGYAEREEARRQGRLTCVQTVLHECGRQKTANISRWVANFLSEGEPLVVFAQHRDVINALLESFPQAVSITRSDTLAQRDHAVRAFQTGKTQLIVCSMHAAGVGVTLTRAAHVAFAEIGWSAAAHDQAEARIHRIGHEQATTAWYLVGDETIDELVLDVINRKRVMAGQLHESVLVEVAHELARVTQPRSEAGGAQPTQRAAGPDSRGVG